MVDSEKVYDEFMGLIGRLSNNEIKMLIDNLKEYVENDELFEEDEENQRTCSECNKEMNEGYCIENGFEYYCSDECLHEHYTDEEFEELYDDGNGDSYWTEWESIKNE